MKLRLAGLALAALTISIGFVQASEVEQSKRALRFAQAPRVCLNCPPNSTVCYPNTCDNKGCRVTGQACSVIGGAATGCPAIPFC